MIRLFRKHAEADRDKRWALWIERMGKGDIDALSSIYDETSPVIFSLVLEILGHRQTAEDTLIEIYDQARRNAHSFHRRGQSPLDWLITLARDVAIEVRKKSPAELNQQVQFATLAAERISEEQRCILEMTYLRGMTAAEVAGVLALSPEYVKRQIVLALRELRGAGAPSIVPSSKIAVCS